MKDYHKTLMKQPSFRHAAGISMAVQSVHNFTPTPNYTPAEIAYFRGLDARRRGRPESDNTYADEQPGLSAEWLRGYGDGTGNNNPPRLDQPADGDQDRLDQPDLGEH